MSLNFYSLENNKISFQVNKKLFGKDTIVYPILSSDKIYIEDNDFIKYDDQ